MDGEGLLGGAGEGGAGGEEEVDPAGDEGGVGVGPVRERPVVRLDAHLLHLPQRVPRLAHPQQPAHVVAL